MRTPVLLSAVALPMLAFGVRAADIHVPGDEPTIQAALAVAFPGDSIVLASGFYPIGAQINVNVSDITIRSASGNPADTILDGGGAAITCFDVTNRIDVTFQAITLSRFECAIAMNSAGVTVDGCWILSNSPGVIRGAVASVLSGLTVTGCVFDQNVSADSGAALSIYGSQAIVKASTFTNNATPQGAAEPDFEGAAITSGIAFNDEFELFGSAISVTDCVFADNVSDYGGAVLFGGAEGSVDRCLFVSNSARHGGGLFARSIDFGALGFFQADVTVTNSVFAGNDVAAVGIFSSGRGSAIGAINAILTIANNTFYANPAEIDQTIWGDLATSGTVCNNLFCDTAAPAFDGTLFASSRNSTVSTAAFVDADGADNIPGTPDDDLHLAPGSSPIDAGDNACVPAGILFDYDAADRFTDDPATADTGLGSAPIVDIGAFEFVPGSGPCGPADLATPFGQLDFSDVVAFLTAFGLSDPAADLAAPFGQWDFSDVVAFLSAFGAGCP